MSFKRKRCDEADHSIEGKSESVAALMTEYAEGSVDWSNTNDHTEHSSSDFCNVSLAEWFSANNIKRQAANDLLLLLSKKTPEVAQDVRNLKCAPSSIEKQIVEQQQQLITKMDQIATEFMSMRAEMKSINAKVCRWVPRANEIIPLQSYKTMDDLLNFDESLKDDKTFKKFVEELLVTGAKPFGMFIRKSWRSICSDEVARLCSWRDSEDKKCVRGMHITLAIRSAFKQMFAMEDSVFDRITQKFFLYAQDRLTKGEKSRANSKRARNATPECFDTHNNI